MADETCGAPAILGPCVMPAGHNRGRVDIPENHNADPWGLVIDQVVGLAAVYDIPDGGPTTPDQVHDLWRQILAAIADGFRATAIASRVSTVERVTQQLADVTAERDAYRDASDQWHLLTEALPGDLRIILDPSDPDDSSAWRGRIRAAMWSAYGIGRRHQRDGLTYAGTAARGPFETEQAVTDPEWTEPPRS